MIWFTRSRRKINGTFTPLLRWFRSIGTSAGHAWRRSLQLRVVVSTLTLSLVVIVILGAVLTGQITDRLLEAKISAATEELERSRTTVEGALAGAEDSDGLNARLERARA
ncbi:MAG: two-component sensor histidine kinase, partial [Rhodococcus sp. (in: high G+C Gram-positive bacteria)]